MREAVKGLQRLQKYRNINWSFKKKKKRHMNTRHDDMGEKFKKNHVFFMRF